MERALLSEVMACGSLPLLVMQAMAVAVRTAIASAPFAFRLEARNPRPRNASSTPAAAKASTQSIVSAIEAVEKVSLFAFEKASCMFDCTATKWSLKEHLPGRSCFESATQAPCNLIVRVGPSNLSALVTGLLSKIISWLCLSTMYCGFQPFETERPKMGTGCSHNCSTSTMPSLMTRRWLAAALRAAVRGRSPSCSSISGSRSGRGAGRGAGAR
mmetsp:Transcript_64197/g.169636  ORF Transcript_64197/g.169636 Transcript_64197/m.169636 type:complete len:215 (-) Transcript_64197:288-932(-)